MDGELAISNGITRCKIDPDGVVDLYESYIIPLTKEVEVCIVRISISLKFDLVQGRLPAESLGRSDEGRNRGIISTKSFLKVHLAQRYWIDIYLDDLLSSNNFTL